MRDRFKDRLQYGDMISRCISEGKTVPWYFVHCYNDAVYDCEAVVKSEAAEGANGD